MGTRPPLDPRRVLSEITELDDLREKKVQIEIPKITEADADTLKFSIWLTIKEMDYSNEAMAGAFCVGDRILKLTRLRRVSSKVNLKIRLKRIIDGIEPTSPEHFKKALVCMSPCTVTVSRRSYTSAPGEERLRLSLEAIGHPIQAGYSYQVVVCKKKERDRFLTTSFGFTTEDVFGKLVIGEIKAKTAAAKYFAVGDGIIDVNGESLKPDDPMELRQFNTQFHEGVEMAVLIERPFSKEARTLTEGYIKKHLKCRLLEELVPFQSIIEGMQSEQVEVEEDQDEEETQSEKWKEYRLKYDMLWPVDQSRLLVLIIQQDTNPVELKLIALKLLKNVIWQPYSSKLLEVGNQLLKVAYSHEELRSKITEIIGVIFQEMKYRSQGKFSMCQAEWPELSSLIASYRTEAPTALKLLILGIMRACPQYGSKTQVEENLWKASLDSDGRVRVAAIRAFTTCSQGLDESPLTRHLFELAMADRSMEGGSPRDTIKNALYNGNLIPFVESILKEKGEEATILLEFVVPSLCQVFEKLSKEKRCVEALFMASSEAEYQLDLARMMARESGALILPFIDLLSSTSFQMLQQRENLYLHPYAVQMFPLLMNSLKTGSKQDELLVLWSKYLRSMMNAIKNCECDMSQLGYKESLEACIEVVPEEFVSNENKAEIDDFLRDPRTNYEKRFDQSTEEEGEDEEKSNSEDSELETAISLSSSYMEQEEIDSCETATSFSSSHSECKEQDEMPAH